MGGVLVEDLDTRINIHKQPGTNDKYLYRNSKIFNLLGYPIHHS